MWRANFSSIETLEKDFKIQAKSKARVTLVPSSRTGSNAVRLLTTPGDNNVDGSMTMERCDLMQVVPGGSAPLVHREVKQRWRFSVMFPGDCVFPKGPAGMVLDFHNWPDAPGMPNLILNFANWNGDRSLLGQLQLERWFGDPKAPSVRRVIVDANPKTDVWYDFELDVFWTASADGYCAVKANGRVVMDDVGPTTYPGAGVYLKLANYHSPIAADGLLASPVKPAVPFSVIHDRVQMEQG